MRFVSRTRSLMPGSPRADSHFSGATSDILYYFAPVNPDQPLIDQLYREKVWRARQRTPGERMGDVLELSEMDFGKDDPKLKRRLAIARAMEERRYYGPSQPRV